VSDTEAAAAAQEKAVTLERRRHVLLIGLNRPEKRQATSLADFAKWTASAWAEEVTQ
jgi:hypothetical protein